MKLTEMFKSYAINKKWKVRFFQYKNRLSTHIGGGIGIRTPGCLHINSFQDCRIRPLCHSSKTLSLACALPLTIFATHCKLIVFAQLTLLPRLELVLTRFFVFCIFCCVLTFFTNKICIKLFCKPATFASFVVSLQFCHLVFCAHPHKLSALT